MLSVHTAVVVIQLPVFPLSEFMAGIQVRHNHWVKSLLMNSQVITGLGNLLVGDRSSSVHQGTSEVFKSNSSWSGTESRQAIRENSLQRQVRDRLGRSRAGRQKTTLKSLALHRRATGAADQEAWCRWSRERRRNTGGRPAAVTPSLSQCHVVSH